MDRSSPVAKLFSVAPSRVGLPAEAPASNGAAVRVSAVTIANTRNRMTWASTR